jgi:hypothetical protein
MQRVAGRVERLYLCVAVRQPSPLRSSELLDEQAIRFVLMNYLLIDAIQLSVGVLVLIARFSIHLGLSLSKRG